LPSWSLEFPDFSHILEGVPKTTVMVTYVLPITAANFGEMLTRFQRQSNMLVRRAEPNWIVQKFADEGSTSPFMARLYLGILRLRDINYADPAKRETFDKPYEFVMSSLMNARTHGEGARNPLGRAYPEGRIRRDRAVAGQGYLYRRERRQGTQETWRFSRKDARRKCGYRKHSFKRSKT
jgi:hypothetical protein